MYNKLIFKVVIICFLISGGISSAQSDGFFNNWENIELRDNDGMTAPAMPNHGTTDDYDMPLGHGLLLLGMFAAAYLIVKKCKAKKSALMLILALTPFLADAQEVDVEWTYNPHAFQTNMVGYAKVIVDGVSMTNAQYEIGAFVGDECRGKALCNLPGLYQASLVIHGKDGDVIHFKVMDHNNNWVIFADCDDTLHFKADRYYAPPSAPKEVKLRTIYYNYNGGSVDQISSYTLSNGNSVVKLPLRNCKVVVNDDITYSDGSTQLKDVIITTGRKMEISAGGGLATMETLENHNGVEGIWIKATAPQSGSKGDYWDEKFCSVGSLVTVSPGVMGTMETYLDNSATKHDWHLISSPVTNQVIHNNLNDSDFEPSANDDFFLWDETRATWCNIKNGEFSATNNFHNLNGNSFNFVPGRGYLASYSEAGVKEYSGVFNQGDVTVNLTWTETIDDKPNRYLGFNLVGNPYPSFLDWENIDGWNRSRIYGYNAEPDESHCVIWIYNEDEGNYSVYVQGGGGISTLHATQYIAPGQAFFVKATQAGDFVMRDAARTNEHAKSGFMKGQDFLVRQDGQDLQDGLIRQDEQDLQDVLKIRVENEKLGADEVVLAVSGKEMKVEKLFSMSETAPAMYFNEDGKYSIIIDDDFENSIPLNFKAKQMGKYTIKLNPETSGFDFVELEDSFTGEKVNLLTEEYSFYATKNDAENRFKLNLNPDTNPDLNPSFVWQNGNDLIVKGKGHLQVVDVLGRTIFEKELTGDENVISCDYINKGVNIFKLEDKTQKIIIR